MEEFWGQFVSGFPCMCLCFKGVLVRNHSYENDFDLHENETACRTHFHMKSFTLRLVLKQRHKRLTQRKLRGIVQWVRRFCSQASEFLMLLAQRASHVKIFKEIILKSLNYCKKWDFFLICTR